MAKKRIQTPAEKMNDALTTFMEEVALKIASLENYYWFMARDLSVTITAVKSMKNLLAQKKIISPKQFDKEYNKLYKELIEISEKAEKRELDIIRKSQLSVDEIRNIINDPNVGHS